MDRKEWRYCYQVSLWYHSFGSKKQYKHNSFSCEHLKETMYQRRYVSTVTSLIKTMNYEKIMFNGMTTLNGKKNSGIKSQRYFHIWNSALQHSQSRC